MRNSLVVPVAIVIAGGILATGVYAYFHARAMHITPGAGNPEAVQAVGGNDHILGNPDAPVVFVEYSDIDCPFCKNFRATMESLMASYGAGGKIAWVYRHLPVTDLHPNSESHAEAAECVAAQGGTSAFFKFIDLVNTAAPGTTQFNPAQYDSVVQKLGLNTDTFDSCMQNQTYKKRVADDAQNALEAGAAGTPYTLLLIKGQKPVAISGAFSLDQMKEITVAALEKAGVK